MIYLMLNNHVRIMNKFSKSQVSCSFSFCWHYMNPSLVHILFWVSLTWSFSSSASMELGQSSCFTVTCLVEICSQTSQNVERWCQKHLRPRLIEQSGSSARIFPSDGFGARLSLLERRGEDWFWVWYKHLLDSQKLHVVPLRANSYPLSPHSELLKYKVH